MKPSQHFHGRRLREVREARCMHSKVLAGKIAVSEASVSQYESGDQMPSPAVVDRICETLGVPVHFFTSPDETEASFLFWRSRSAATKRIRTSIERQFAWLHAIVRVVEQAVEFPPDNVPDFDLPADPTAINDELIDDVARNTRRYWQLGDGPIENVVWLVENNGVIVVRNELGDERLDAFSCRVSNGPISRCFVVLGTEKESAARSRFDLGHELGHCILHRRVAERVARNSELHNLLERQADRFSSAFHLPAESFLTEAYSHDPESLVHLKRRWQVSIACMLMRLSDLDVISDQQRTNAFVKLSRLGWRKREPLDDVLLPEQPKLLKEAIAMLIDHAVIAPTALEQYVHLYQHEIERLLGVPRGFMSNAPPSVPIKLKLDRDVSNDALARWGHPTPETLDR